MAELRPRWKAVAWDLGFIAALGCALFVLVGTFWMPLSILTVCYYVGGILVLGNTPGVCLFAPVPHDAESRHQSEPETGNLGLTLSLTSRDL